TAFRLTPASAIFRVSFPNAPGLSSMSRTRASCSPVTREPALCSAWRAFKGSSTSTWPTPLPPTTNPQIPSMLTPALPNASAAAATVPTFSSSSIVRSLRWCAIVPTSLVSRADGAGAHSRLDISTWIVEPVQANTQQGDSEGHHQQQERGASDPPDDGRLPFEGTRPIEPQRPDCDRQHRQAAEHDAEHWVGGDERLDDVEPCQRDENDDDRDQEGAVKPASKPRGTRRAPTG